MSFIGKALGLIKDDFKAVGITGKGLKGVAKPSSAFGWAAYGAGKTGMFAGKMALGTSGGRILTGAVGGALYGGVTSPYDNINSTVERMMYGAIGGAALGGLASVGWHTAKYADRQLGKAVSNPGDTLRKLDDASYAIGKRGYNAGKKILGAGSLAARMAGGVSLAALRFPVITAGVIGGAMAFGGVADAVNNNIYGQSVLEDNPYGTLSSAQANLSLQNEMQGAQLLADASVMPTGSIRPARAMLMGSTEGLVQGLHRGRHR